MKKFVFLAASLAALFAFNACSDSDSVDYENLDKINIDFSSHSLALQKANNCDDYRKHILDTIAKRVADERFHTYFYYEAMEDGIDYAEGVEPPSSSASNDKSESAGDYSTTNNQEAGADELDSVKNDGTHMYVLENNVVHIAKVWPADDMIELTTIAPTTHQVSNEGYAPYESTYYFDGLLLDNNRLITIESNRRWRGGSDNDFIVSVYDITNPEKPALVKKHTIEGNFIDARMINHRLFIASSSNVEGDWRTLYELSESDIPGVPKFEEPEPNWNFDKQVEEYNTKYEEWNAQYDTNMKRYLPVIRAWLETKYQTIQDFDWPQYSDGQTTKDAVSCQDLYLPSTTSKDFGLLLVSEFSGSNFENFKSNAVADSGWLVYASTKNFYLVSDSSYWWWDCVSSDSSCGAYSHIHHFDLGDTDGGLKYVNSAEVDGYIEESFYLSDYDNHLRVVSSPTWGNSPTGHKLSIFDNTTPTTMKLTGSVSGFGKNERIYSARMIGTRGYVVTYRNTDPLFTFDLSNPANPQLAGELKINGYSSYIHPLGDNHLLTIGEDSDENGRTLGMKLELFDVSDIHAPKSVAKTLINEEKSDGYGYSSGWSDALYDHHALNFHEKSGLLAIPVNLYQWHYNSWNYSQFTGMFVYRVTPSDNENAFTFVGGVNHGPLIDNKDEHYWWTSLDRARFYFKTDGVYDKDAYLYTVSNHGMMASDANSPDTMVKAIKFK